MLNTLLAILGIALLIISTGVTDPITGTFIAFSALIPLGIANYRIWSDIDLKSSSCE